MKISTRGRYALKMMVEFAINSDTPTKINQVSKSYGISEKYLEQIVSILSKAKLVKSIRGAQGGYFLTKDIKEISVGEVIKPLEGDLSPAKCVEEDGYCDMLDRCPTYMIWDNIKKAIDDVVDNTTLSDMVDEYYKKHKLKSRD